MDATFWVTYACNMKCSYCYEGSNKKTNSMSKKTVDDAISYIENHINGLLNEKELYISFHGGEPLLEINLIKYIIEQVDIRFKNSVIKPFYSITTNGTLLIKEVCDYLIENFYDISLSIDGEKESNNSQRILLGDFATYESIIQNYKYILTKKQDVRIRMTLTSSNVYKLADNVRYLIELGFKVIVVAPDMFDINWDKKHLVVLRGQLNILLESIDFEQERICFSFAEKDFLYRRAPICFGGITSIHIDPDGDLYPCSYIVGNSSFKIGDIRNGIIPEKLALLKRVNQNPNYECEGCTRYDYCRGTTCKIVNKLVTGNYDVPPAIRCNIQNIQFDILKRIHASKNK